MSETTYIPSGGLIGKLNRLNARLRAREPMGLKKELVVSVSFDDFPKSAREFGAKALEKRGWRGTYYTAAGFSGTNTHHGTMMDAGDILALADAGHEIACHTLNHVDLCRAGKNTATAQVEANATALSAIGCKAHLSHFAFPFGEASPSVKMALSRRFKTLRGVQPGLNRTGDDRLLLKAVGIDGGPAGIARCHAWVKMGCRDPGWLIFYAHDIQENPTDWGCTPAEFESVLDAVEKANARVMPIGEAYDYLTE